MSEKESTKELLGFTNEEAGQLVDKYIKDEIIKLHLIETEAIMRSLAKHFEEDEDVWGMVGLLHDLDWDLTKNNPKEHCTRVVEILKDEGATEYLIETIISHAYGHDLNENYKSKQREGKIQFSLAAAETLTGLIVASALVQPDKKLESVKLKSLKKKFKARAFAANCDREIIRECEKTDIELGDFLEIGLKSLQSISDRLGM